MVLTVGLAIGGCAHEVSQGADAAGAEAQTLVALDTLTAAIEQDMRYHGARNFMGQPVTGYLAPRCWLSRPAAAALVNVQRDAAKHGLRVKVFDCYRPQRAVDDFVRWGKDLGDQTTKAEYYPRVPKTELFSRGYIAERSGHSRASTVDMGLVVVNAALAGQVLKGPLVSGREVDMATPFDLFDERSHTETQLVGTAARHNRLWLRTLMERHGWRNLPEEWWHFTLRDEPFPDRYFDLPVQ
ncbi:M15 family metallopeptidase [Ottowia sp. GY511]|nr:M15 family metallopeptidase [Ottowia sp. GY511]